MLYLLPSSTEFLKRQSRNNNAAVGYRQRYLALKGSGKSPFRTQMSPCVSWKPESTQFKVTERQKTQPVSAIKLEQRFVWLLDLKGRII